MPVEVPVPMPIKVACELFLSLLPGLLSVPCCLQVSNSDYSKKDFQMDYWTLLWFQMDYGWFMCLFQFSSLTHWTPARTHRPASSTWTSFFLLIEFPFYTSLCLCFSIKNLVCLYLLCLSLKYMLCALPHTHMSCILAKSDTDMTIGKQSVQNDEICV